MSEQLEFWKESKTSANYKQREEYSVHHQDNLNVQSQGRGNDNESAKEKPLQDNLNCVNQMQVKSLNASGLTPSPPLPPTASCASYSSIDFTDLQKIGEGAHSYVYKTQIDGKYVALKKFPIENRETALKEYDFLMKCKHNHIVECFNTLESDQSCIYLVMELMSEGNLNGHLQKCHFTQIEILEL